MIREDLPGLVDVGCDKHFRVKHSKNEFAKAGKAIHIDGRESFWSFTKKDWLNSMAPKQTSISILKEGECWGNKFTEQLIKELFQIIKNTK